jgi:UDP-perosamine 4-acetyltransferase
VKLVLIGAGGHARSVLDAVRSSAAPLHPVACTDPDPELHGACIDGVPIEGGDDLLEDLISRGLTGACIGLGGTADNGPRATLFERLVRLGFELPPVIHGFAHVAHSATLGAADVVLAGAVVGAGAGCGQNVIVGSNVVVEHDCSIADHVHLAGGCVLGGAVEVHRGAHVGLGARVLEGRTVGERAVVGAGAVVIRDVPPGETVVGCPATSKGGRR